MLIVVLALHGLAVAADPPAPDALVERKIILEGWSADQLTAAIDLALQAEGDKKKARTVQFYQGADDLIVRSRFTRPIQWDITIKARNTDAPLPEAQGVPATSKSESDESWTLDTKTLPEPTTSRSISVKSTKEEPVKTLEASELPAKIAAYFPAACAHTPCQTVCGAIREQRWEWEVGAAEYTLSTWTRDGASITEWSARGVSQEDWIHLLDTLAAQPNPPTSRVQSKTAWATTCTPP